MPRLVGLPPPPRRRRPGVDDEHRVRVPPRRFPGEKTVDPLGIVAVLTVIAVFLALRLKMLTGSESLLPENRPSVQELNRVAAKTAGVSTLFVALQGGPDTKVESLRKAADALVPRSPSSARRGSAASRTASTRRCSSSRRAPASSSTRTSSPSSRRRSRIASTTRSPSRAARSSTTARAPPELNPAKIKADLGITDDLQQRYPDGYYQSQDGKVVIVAIRSKVLGSDFNNGTEALRRIRAVIDQVNPKSFDPGITYGFAGDLQTGISEYTSINNDLTEVGYFGAVLITAVVFLYYLRVRTLIAMVITIAVGVSWTFGFTKLAIGHLNLATGFLFTIIAGNGINFGIIYMSRFLEARAAAPRSRTACASPTARHGWRR